MDKGKTMVAQTKGKVVVNTEGKMMAENKGKVVVEQEITPKRSRN